MGTNYYTRTNECKHCGRYDGLHLGKSSAGWQFSFQYNGGKYYKNVPEMKKWLKGKTITDEYGKTISAQAFWKMVAAKQTPENKNHAAHVKANYGTQSAASEHIIDGYSFSDTEFS